MKEECFFSAHLASLALDFSESTFGLPVMALLVVLRRKGPVGAPFQGPVTNQTTHSIYNELCTSCLCTVITFLNLYSFYL
jgi:hypothetical protein